MVIGIDASNLRSGGGLLHVRRLLESVVPSDHGISSVIVWSGRKTLDQLPGSRSRPWLHLVHQELLDQPLPQRTWWQLVELPKQAIHKCNVLFAPGGRHSDQIRPVVTMCQNMLPFEAEERKRYKVSWTRLRYQILGPYQASSFRRADGVIFPTEYAREVVVDKTGPLRGMSRVIPHGVDEGFRAPVRTQNLISAYSLAAPFSILYVSPLDVYKHHAEVILAVARIRKKGIPIKLTLAGRAYHRTMRQVQNLLKECDPNQEFVNYHGEVEHDKLPQLYHEVDAFMFASSCESISITVLEAMAAGLPIACSRRGAMPEMLRDAGLYFDPEAPDEIESALMTLVQDPLLRSTIARRASAYAQQLTWKQCADQTFSFLAEVVESSRKQL